MKNETKATEKQKTTTNRRSFMGAAAGVGKEKVMVSDKTYNQMCVWG